MTLLELAGFSVARARREVVHDVALRVGEGEVVGLIGPNGAGKTTLLRGALGLLPHRGRSSLAEMLPLDRARHAAWLPQMREIAWPVTVETVVGLGRLPHQRPGESTRADAAVAAALERMRLTGFRERIATRLSGGEQARVLIARALAQETPLIVADEPIAGLDPAHQLATMEVFADLAAEGRSILVALHDLALAARGCSRLVLLDGGRIRADGPPVEVLAPAHMAAVFGLRAGLLDTGSGPVFHVEGRI